MSKSVTVLLTASRSSARSAPISYTPPVKPPPPSTSAVLLGRRRPAPAPRRPVTGLETAPERPRARAPAEDRRSLTVVGASLTPLPIPRILYGCVPRHRSSPLPLLLCLALVSATAFAGASASASATALANASASASELALANASASASATALQAHLTHELALAGPLSGGFVEDLSTKATLFSVRAQDLRAPASVEKLYTANTAIQRLGPDARLETTVLGAGHLAAGGVWEGSLYLHGGGDPTVGTTAVIDSHYGGLGTSVATLVQQLVHTDGIHRVTGAIEGDESYFDSLRGEPSSGYQEDPYLEGTLSALAFDRGESGSYDGPHAPAAYAAHELLRELRAAGVEVHGGSGAATTPAGPPRGRASCAKRSPASASTPTSSTARASRAKTRPPRSRS